MFVSSPIAIRSVSPRITVLYQMLTSFPRWTSPRTIAPWAMKADGSIMREPPGLQGGGAAEISALCGGGANTDGARFNVADSGVPGQVSRVEAAAGRLRRGASAPGAAAGPPPGPRGDKNRS